MSEIKQTDLARKIPQMKFVSRLSQHQQETDTFYVAPIYGPQQFPGNIPVFPPLNIYLHPINVADIVSNRLNSFAAPQHISKIME